MGRYLVNLIVTFGELFRGSNITVMWLKLPPNDQEIEGNRLEDWEQIFGKVYI